jgi:hypothetical protein
MKKIGVLFLVFMMLRGLSLLAQPMVDDMSKALTKGQVAEMSKYFDKSVVITIDNKQTIYSKSQAEMVLKKFISKTGSKTFKLKYDSGVVNNDAVFMIGELEGTNHNYRVYFSFKKHLDDYVLEQVKFEQ